MDEEDFIPAEEALKRATPASQLLEFYDDYSELTFRLITRDGVRVGKYADPTEGLLLDLLPSKSAEIARENIDLLFLYS